MVDRIIESGETRLTEDDEVRILEEPIGGVALLVGVILRGRLQPHGREIAQPYASFATVYTAIAGPWSTDRPQSLQLRIQTLASRLQDRLQALTYAGSGGENGTEDLAGRTRPLCFGHVMNVTAQLVDPAELIYQVHSGSIEAIDAVYDQGVEVEFDGSPGGADYATYALLEAAVVPNGFYSTCLAEGYFKLGRLPTGAVTANMQGDNTGGYVDMHAGIVRRMLLSHSPLLSTNLDETSFTALDSAQPAEIGIFFGAGDQNTVEQATERVLFSAGAFGGQDRSGLYRVQLLAVPGTTPHWSFDDRDIIDIARLPLPYGVPWKAWGVSYQHNWTVQKGAEVAAGVSQARRQFLEAEDRHAYSSNAAIALAHQTSAGAPLRPSLFHNAADAATEAARLIELYALGRALYRVVVKTALFSVELGQTVRLIYPRWNLAQGRSFVVLSVLDEADQRATELVVFG